MWTDSSQRRWQGAAPELVLVLASVLCWGAALVGSLGFLPFAGVFSLSLYPYFGVAALAGWLAGNVYVVRRRRLGELLGGRLLIVWLLGPPGGLFFLRTLAGEALQQAAPLVPVYACGVYGVLFAVPVTFSRSATT